MKKACDNLTLSLPITTIAPYANSLGPNEMPSNSTSDPDPSCLTLRHFQTLSNIEALRKLKQARNLADDNLFGGVRVNCMDGLFVFNNVFTKVHKTKEENTT